MSVNSPFGEIRCLSRYSVDCVNVDISMNYNHAMFIHRLLNK